VIVDATIGPMRQTRFLLAQGAEQGLAAICLFIKYIRRGDPEQR